jgi:hypothetical protein
LSIRTATITDWRHRDEDLPDVPPGWEYERVITPQKFIVLRRVIVHNYMILIRLQIGTAEVPFELENEDDSQWSERGSRIYKPKGLDDKALKKSIVATGAAVATSDSIAIVPGLEIHATLRNDRGIPTKPRASLLVQEEAP